MITSVGKCYRLPYLPDFPHGAICKRPVIPLPRTVICHGALLIKTPVANQSLGEAEIQRPLENGAGARIIQTQNRPDGECCNAEKDCADHDYGIKGGRE